MKNQLQPCSVGGFPIAGYNGEYIPPLSKTSLSCLKAFLIWISSFTAAWKVDSRLPSSKAILALSPTAPLFLL